jgi:hypothetical protein
VQSQQRASSSPIDGGVSQYPDSIICSHRYLDVLSNDFGIGQNILYNKNGLG